MHNIIQGIRNCMQICGGDSTEWNNVIALIDKTYMILKIQGAKTSFYNKFKL